MRMGPVAALVRKDLQIFFGDVRAVLLTLAVPIAIASFFGYVFSGPRAGAEPARIRIAVVDRDGSTISKALIDRMASDRALDVTRPALEAARADVRAGRLALGVVIPPGFGAAAGSAFLAQTARPQLELLIDPSKPAEVSMVRGILTGHVMEAVSQEMFAGAQGRQFTDDSLRALDSSGMPAEQRELLRRLLESAQGLNRAQDAAGLAAPRPGLSMPFAVREEAAAGDTRRPYDGYGHAFAGMSVQFALFAAIELAVGILLERQRGLWKRLRSAPLSRTTLLLAKAISGTILTLMTLLASFLFARIVFGVQIASLPGFFAVAIASAIMASTFGLLLAAIGGTPEATRRVAIFVVLVSVMLGGAWVPSFLFPAWLQTATQAVPVRWAVDGLDSMTWRGLGPSEVVVPVTLILGFAAVCAAAAVWRFRWEEN